MAPQVGNLSDQKWGISVIAVNGVLQRTPAMRIELISVFVHDQAEALAFYTDVLGFQKRRDIPLGQDSWLTVVSPDDPDGPEVLLEPSHHPAVKPYRDALMTAGIPVAQFLVDDVAAEYERLAAAGGHVHPAADRCRRSVDRRV